MKNLFHRMFYLYAGEGRNAFLFVCLAFLWTLGVYSQLTLADGLFLEHAGARHLALAYLLIALGLFFIASIFLYLFHRFTPIKIYLAVLTCAFAVNSAFFIAYDHTSHSLNFWFCFKVYANIAFVLLTTCFWFFVDQYYNLQNAKRLYSLFNSAIFLGNACGAGLVSMFLNHMGLKGLLTLACLLTISTFATVCYIAKTTKHQQDDLAETQVKGEKHALKTLVKRILCSKFTILLIAAYLVIQILNIVTEYSYMEGLQRHFHTQQEDAENSITIFLGQCMAWIAVANMLCGIFLYSRVVSRLGVNNTLLISPLFFAATYLGWTVSDALILSVMAVAAVEGVSYLVDESNSNLLLNAVPQEIKNKVRIAIDSFFEPLGMLLSALIFLLWSPNPVMLGISLAALALLVVIALRSTYRDALLRNLSRSAVHFQRKASEWICQLGKKERREAQYGLIAVLRKKSEKNQLMAMQTLLHFNDPRLLPKLLNHLNHMSYKGKLKALELLEQSPFSLDAQVLDRLHHLMRESSHPALKGAIYFYFAKHGLLSPEKIEENLQSANLTFKAAAILALKKSRLGTQSVAHPGIVDWTERLKRSWNLLPAHYIAYLRLQAAGQLKDLLNSSNEDEVVQGLEILRYDASPQSTETLLPFAQDARARVRRAAALALSCSCDASCNVYGQQILQLLAASSDPAIRLPLLQTLGKIRDSSLVRELLLCSIHFRPLEKRQLEEVVCQMGLRSVPALLSLLKDPKVHDRCRLLSGRILGRLALPQLRNNLHEIISCQIDKAYLYFYHSHDPNNILQDLPVLKDALQAAFFSCIDFIIQLLGVAGSIEKSDTLSFSLRSKNPKIRSHAVETLEKTCESKIFFPLKPLIDDRPTQDVLRLYGKENRPVLSVEELLDTLDRSSSPINHVVALTLKAKFNYPNWRASLRLHMDKNEELFHHFAYELLEV